MAGTFTRRAGAAARKAMAGRVPPVRSTTLLSPMPAHLALTAQQRRRFHQQEEQGGKKPVVWPFLVPAAAAVALAKEFRKSKQIDREISEIRKRKDPFGSRRDIERDWFDLQQKYDVVYLHALRTDIEEHLAKLGYNQEEIKDEIGIIITRVKNNSEYNKEIRAIQNADKEFENLIEGVKNRKELSYFEPNKFEQGIKNARDAWMDKFGKCSQEPRFRNRLLHQFNQNLAKAISGFDERAWTRKIHKESNDIQEIVAAVTPRLYERQPFVPDLSDAMDCHNAPGQLPKPLRDAREILEKHIKAVREDIRQQTRDMICRTM